MPVLLSVIHMLIFDNIVRRRHHLKSLVGVRLRQSILLFHFSPNLSFWTVVSFFTHSETVVSFFTQSFVSRPLFHFSPIICPRRRDLNLRPPDLIHDKLDHRTTVSCLVKICLTRLRELFEVIQQIPFDSSSYYFKPPAILSHFENKKSRFAKLPKNKIFWFCIRLDYCLKSSLL